MCERKNEGGSRQIEKSGKQRFKRSHFYFSYDNETRRKFWFWFCRHFEGTILQNLDRHTRLPLDDFFDLNFSFFLHSIAFSCARRGFVTVVIKDRSFFLFLYFTCWDWWNEGNDFCSLFFPSDREIFLVKN